MREGIIYKQDQTADCCLQGDLGYILKELFLHVASNLEACASVADCSQMHLLPLFPLDILYILDNGIADVVTTADIATPFLTTTLFVYSSCKCCTAISL